MLSVQEQIGLHFAIGIEHRRIHVEIFKAGILFGLRLGQLVVAVDGLGLAQVREGGVGRMLHAEENKRHLGKVRPHLAIDRHGQIEGVVGIAATRHVIVAIEQDGGWMIFPDHVLVIILHILGDASAEAPVDHGKAGERFRGLPFHDGRTADKQSRVFRNRVLGIEFLEQLDVFAVPLRVRYLKGALIKGLVRPVQRHHIGVVFRMERIVQPVHAPIGAGGLVEGRHFVLVGAGAAFGLHQKIMERLFVAGVVGPARADARQQQKRRKSQARKFPHHSSPLCVKTKIFIPPGTRKDGPLWVSYAAKAFIAQLRRAQAASRRLAQ